MNRSIHPTPDAARSAPSSVPRRLAPVGSFLVAFASRGDPFRFPEFALIEADAPADAEQQTAALLRANGDNPEQFEIAVMPETLEHSTAA